MKRAGLTAEGVEAKLRELHGNMAAVARHFGCTRGAVWNFCNRRKALQAVQAECRESMKDNAESALYAAVLRGEAWAVCFYLKTQAKGRGYVEKSEQRHEHTGEGGAPLFPPLRELVRALAEGEADGDGRPALPGTAPPAGGGEALP